MAVVKMNKYLVKVNFEDGTFAQKFVFSRTMLFAENQMTSYLTTLGRTDIREITISETDTSMCYNKKCVYTRV